MDIACGLEVQNNGDGHLLRDVGATLKPPSFLRSIEMAQKGEESHV